MTNIRKIRACFRRQCRQNEMGIVSNLDRSKKQKEKGEKKATNESCHIE